MFPFTALFLTLTMAGPLGSPPTTTSDLVIDLRPTAIFAPTTLPVIPNVGLITTSPIDDPAHPTQSIGVTFTFGP